MNRILENFRLEGVVKEVLPLGNGLINDTYRVVTESGPSYVLQRINHAIFKDVELLQNNIEAVTSHIRSKLEAAGETEVDRKVLKFIPLKSDSRTWWFDGTSYWRVSEFIDNTVTVETVNPESSYYAGRTFGNFQSMLADIPVQLGETIPDFHNMELRARQLEEAMAADAVGRASETEVQEIYAQMKEHMEEMCKAERVHREGILPKRVCHCDTKVNNMLFDKNGEVLCVIDLDTVMPSFIFSDYGDFLI